MFAALTANNASWQAGQAQGLLELDLQLLAYLTIILLHLAGEFILFCVLTFCHITCKLPWCP